MGAKETKTPIPIPDETILAAIKLVSFGTVTLTIQKGQVIQLDKTEKVRLDLKKTIS